MNFVDQSAPAIKLVGFVSLRGRGGSLLRLLSSIQLSRMLFLNFQRLPSLKAGITSSKTYFIERVGRDPQIMRGLTDVHHFARIGHAASFLARGHALVRSRPLRPVPS